MQLSEADYLPQQAGVLPPTPWLVLAPHPDDETFGMGGSIAGARAAGGRVGVLVLTDGALGGSGEADLPTTREREVRAAVELLGGAETIFWREPDRGLAPSAQLVERLAAAILQGGYATVFFPAPTEPHPDHRAAAVLAWEALRRCNFAARPVCYEISTQGPVNCLIDISGTVERKTAAMAAYASQIAQRPYAERVLALNRTRTWSLPDGVAYAEGLFVFDPADVPLDAIVASIFGRWLEGVRPGGARAPVSPPAEGNTEAVERSEAATLRAELDALRRSHSWRVTAPLRALATAMRRLHGRQ